MSRDPNASYNSRNPYIYAENNPVNLVDPTGLAPTGVIRGKIKNAEGKPVAEAAVRIGVTVISTNSNGEFQFTLVESGIYTIYYDAVGYGSQVQEGIAVTGTTITPTVFMSPNWSNAIGQPLVFKAGGAESGNKSKYEPFNTVMMESGGSTPLQVTLSGISANADTVSFGALKGGPAGVPVVVVAQGVGRTTGVANLLITSYQWSKGEATLLDMQIAEIGLMPGGSMLGFIFGAYTMK